MKLNILCILWSALDKKFYNFLFKGKNITIFFEKKFQETLVFLGKSGSYKIVRIWDYLLQTNNDRWCHKIVWFVIQFQHFDCGDVI